MKRVIYGCLVATILSGCGLFDKDPLDIEGERLSVIREDKNLQPEYMTGQIKIKLPKAYVNPSWKQNGNNSLHLIGHLKAGGNLDELWNLSFGEGSSKRNVLIASPVADKGVVFTLDAEGVVKAFRLDNGDEIWKRRLKPNNEEAKAASIAGGGIAIHGEQIYATTGFGNVFALNMTDGKVVWNTEIKAPIRIAPTVNENMVLIQTLDNGIYALNIKDGSILWKDKLEAESTMIIGGASPAYSPTNDLVVAAFSNGQLQAYKASTGTALWSEWLSADTSTEALAEITSIKANPIIDGDKVFAVGYNAPLVAIDIRTGAKIWQKEIAASSQPWVAGEFLFILTNDGDLIALNKQNGKIVWRTIVPYANGEDKSGIFTSGPLLANDALLVTSSNGKLFSISPYNGRIMGIADIEEGVEMPPFIVKETLILTTKNAEMTAYK